MWGFGYLPSVFYYRCCNAAASSRGPTARSRDSLGCRVQCAEEMREGQNIGRYITNAVKQKVPQSSGGRPYAVGVYVGVDRWCSAVQCSNLGNFNLTASHGDRIT